MAKLLNYWRFEAGDAVPAFLIDAEPVEPGAARPAIVFPVATDVFETEERFVCAPVEPSPSATIDVLGGRTRVKIFAAHKPVVAVSRWQTMLAAEDA